jgi:hypothetical protein
MSTSYYVSVAVEAGLCYYFGPRYGYDPMTSAVVGTAIIEGAEYFTGYYPLKMLFDGLMGMGSMSSMRKSGCVLY